MENIKVTRREFIRDGAIAAAGVAAGLSVIGQNAKAVTHRKFSITTRIWNTAGRARPILWSQPSASAGTPGATRPNAMKLSAAVST